MEHVRTQRKLRRCAYPTLTRQGVLAAIKYAAHVLRLDVVFPIGACVRYLAVIDLHGDRD